LYFFFEPQGHSSFRPVFNRDCQSLSAIFYPLRWMMVDVIILGMEKLSDKPFTFIQYDESPGRGFVFLSQITL